jgi:serine/threonine protein phosphatase 1
VKRHLAIGDIHGCINALSSLIDYVAPRPDDTIVSLGDYVDRGPDSRAVLDFVIELGKTHTLVPLRGNHEIMMLDSREMNSWYEAWLGYGGEATLLSYSPAADVEGSFADIPDAHIDFLENELVSYYECDSHFFVHGSIGASTRIRNHTVPARSWSAAIQRNEPDYHSTTVIPYVSIPGHMGTVG